MEKPSKRPSLNQLAELLAERAGKKYDLGFKEEMKVAIHYWRQRLLVDSLNSRPEDREFFKVWFDMKLEVTSISTFEGFPEDTCVKRTTKCLPKAIRANGTIVDFIGYLNKEKRIPLTRSLQTAKILNQSQFSPAQARAVLINGYIYTFNYFGPGISVAMIPEDMSEVPSEGLDCFDCVTNKNICYTDDMPYPVSGDIAQRIVQAILATELSRNVVDPKKEEVPVSNEEK